MKAVQIEWDVDDPRELDDLPTEVRIPDGITDMEQIGDYLSECTGYCHKGFCLIGPGE